MRNFSLTVAGRACSFPTSDQALSRSCCIFGTALDLVGCNTFQIRGNHASPCAAHPLSSSDPPG